VIELDRVTVTYEGAPAPTLRDVDLSIPEGELCLVVGHTGVGKSTLLGLLNGLVPHFTGGTLRGRVEVDGRDTRTHPPRELADVVGVVGQDPLAGFVTDSVEDELAYGMELLAVPPATMRKRVEETLDLLGIAELRGRSLRTLSGGQQQRVAIGSVLTAHPRVLVLDEPTSALDPTAAEEVLAAVTRLVHDLGVTVVMAEHRLERAVQYADRILHLPGDGSVRSGPPADVLATSDIAPPVVHLGRLAGWDPLPLSVRDARRRAAPLREALADRPRRPRGNLAVLAGATGGDPDRVGAPATPTGPDTRTATHTPAGPDTPTGPDTPPGADARTATDTPTGLVAPTGPDTPTATDARIGAGETDPAGGPPALAATDVVVAYGSRIAVAGVDLRVARGEVVALMGRNGSGKSSLLWALQGSGPRLRGTILVGGEPHGGGDGNHRPSARRGGGDRAGRSSVGLVPQTPSDLLYLRTVAEELAAADAEAGAEPGTARALLDRLLPGIDGDHHPRDLSEGQRLGLVLAVQLTPDPQVVLLDEPTRGLDYRAKGRLRAIIRELTAEGRAVLLSTHDVELAAELADRVVVLADGEVVADGPSDEVLASSPAFAPQVAKVLAPAVWLTVDEVREALAGASEPHGTPEAAS